MANETKPAKAGAQAGPNKATGSPRPSASPVPGSLTAVPQSTAIQKSPALCTATAKWKSRLPSALLTELPAQDGGLSADEGHTAPMNTPAAVTDTKGGVVGPETSPLVGVPSGSSPSKQANGTAAALHGEANKMGRPAISITEAPDQQGRPPSRISGRASASSLSMLAESGKLLQAVPLATGGTAGQQQASVSGSLRINNHSLVAAIPYMPVPLAYVCLLLNILIPGLGTLISGFSIFCCKAEPQQTTKNDELISSCCTNVCVSVSQLFTIPFLLVGWIWSITWGVFMVLFAVEYRNYKRNEKTITKMKAVTKAFMGR